MSLLSQNYVPLNCLIKENKYGLCKITPSYAYEDGRKTDALRGYKYSVVNLGAGYNSLIIFVAHDRPIISQDELSQLQSQGENVIVSFTNARVKAYINAVSETLADSIIADDITIVKK